MGIPKYHKWLTERFPKAFKTSSSDHAEHVYVDINALLHEVLRHSSTEDQFIKELFQRLDQLFTKVMPGKTLFLAVDGPASFAKTLTQRKRRRAHLHKEKKEGNPKLSGNMITPGVPFMSRLSEALEYYAASRMAPGGKLARCESVTVSGVRGVGEGEHKIVSQILRHAAVGAAEEAHVIVSGDADLFLLSLVQGAARRIRVVSQDFQQIQNFRRGGGRTQGSQNLIVWDAEQLSQLIVAEVPNAKTDSAEREVRRDFALISLLSGNDYLPALKSGLPPKQLWTKYMEFRRGSFKDHCLVQAHEVSELPLSHGPEGWATEVGDAGAAFMLEGYEQYSFHGPLLTELMRLAAVGCGQSHEIENSDEGVRAYLQGLLWVMEMYHHGYCPDPFYVFPKSYADCATARLILQYSADFDGMEAPRSQHAPLCPLACGLVMLPVDSAIEYLVPSAPHLREMLTENHPLLGSVVAIERSAARAGHKEKIASLQRELEAVRAAGQPDQHIRAQLSKANEAYNQEREGEEDIDDVPLWEVDAEVRERCSGSALPTLDFAEDVTFNWNTGESNGMPSAPLANLGAISISGLKRSLGEWPAHDGRCTDRQAVVAVSKKRTSESALELVQAPAKRHKVGTPQVQEQRLSAKRQEIEPSLPAGKPPGFMGVQAQHSQENPISALQIFVSKNNTWYQGQPSYNFRCESDGFVCECSLILHDSQVIMSEGYGTAKKEAKQAAAAALLTEVQSC